MKRKTRYLVLSFALFLLLSFLFLFVGTPPRAERVTWGVNFSTKAAEYLGLDWKEAYLALLRDLGVKNIIMMIKSLTTL